MTPHSCKASRARWGLRAQFARVVELGDQTEMFLRAVFLEQVQQLLIHVNPHGQNHRRAAANPDDIQMLHAAQLLQVFMEHGRGVEQGVAAGKQNIADLVMLADIRQDLVAPRLRFPASRPTRRLRKQWRQYMAQALVERTSAVCLYLCCKPVSTVFDASPLVSRRPPGSSSSRAGTHIFRMGS